MEVSVRKTTSFISCASVVDMFVAVSSADIDAGFPLRRQLLLLGEFLTFYL